MNLDTTQVRIEPVDLRRLLVQRRLEALAVVALEATAASLGLYSLHEAHGLPGFVIFEIAVLVVLAASFATHIICDLNDPIRFMRGISCVARGELGADPTDPVVLVGSFPPGSAGFLALVSAREPA